MKKLKIEYLAPYLAYKLKGNLINLEYFDSQINKELYRIETGRTEKSKKYDITVIVGDCESGIEDFKPILRNLSDLTKEIEVNGEKIIPIEKIADIQSFQYPNLKRDRIISDTEYYIKKDILNIPYKIINKLIEWHFNVFSLPEHLYIDINTLEQ